MKRHSVRLTTGMIWACLLAGGVVVVAATPGCSCRPVDPLAEKKKEDEEKKKKKKEKPKADFELGSVQVMPDDGFRATTMLKPAHWVATTQDIKANNFDFVGELVAAIGNKEAEIYEVANTQFQLRTLRPAALPRGQNKNFELMFFVPLRQSHWKEKTVWLERQLRTSRGGRDISADRQPATYMPSYQYMFLVLSDDPDAYGYLKQMATVQAPSGEYHDANIDGRIIYYQVVLPRLERRVSLPGNPLAWTSLAYILWDGTDPKLLATEQQAALVDWLHWGGQLLISGPDSLDVLRGSFLDPFLPAQKVGSRELAGDDFKELNEHWSLPDPTTQEPRWLEVPDNRPLVGVEWVVGPDAHDVGHTGGLAVERQVGAGRVVVTSFSLTAQELVNWRGFESFVHNALMGRPRREFQLRELVPDTVWVDHGPAYLRDARFSTQVRFFSRDIGHLTPSSEEALLRAVSEAAVPQLATGAIVTGGQAAASQIPEPISDVDAEGVRFNGYLSWPQAGVAGWNDRSGVADKAREALKDAAGISIPNAAFVLKVLAIYLLILAPVNWGVFWMLGRIEWAWLAAPFLALAGGLCVVRLAQLDIGFARSVTEVGVLEMHGGHPRAHHTRFTALYTSLSTGYNLGFDEPSTLALPFAVDPNYQRPRYDPAIPVGLRRDRQLTLESFQVPSNKTGVVHSEQMLDLEGGLQLRGSETAGWELRNDSTLAIREAGVVRRLRDNRLERAWIGEVPAKSTVSLRFTPVEDRNVRFDEWNRSAAMSSYTAEADRLLRQFDSNENRELDAQEWASAESLGDADFRATDRDPNRGVNQRELESLLREKGMGELNLGQFADLATRRLRLNAGDVRLVGWTEQALGGLEVRPTSSQAVRKTLVLVHLAHAPHPTPRPDKNCVLDIQPPMPVEDSQEATDAPRKGGPAPGSEPAPQSGSAPQSPGAPA